MADSKAERPGIMSGEGMTGLARAALLAGASVLFVVGQVATADAQFWQLPFRYAPQARPDSQVYQDLRSRDETRARRSNRNTADKAKSKKDVPIKHPFGEDMPKGPLQLVISISDQRAILYSNGVRVADTKVSTGTASHPTPTGVFSIIQKNRWHRSNLYDDAPMYYMHRLTWSGVALHEGHLPGFAASHGCIRMPTAFVSRLWNVSRLGMRVVVARVEVTPKDFTHAKLFNPAQKPVDTSRTSEVPAELRPSLDTAGLVRVAEAQPAEAGIASDAPETAATDSPMTASPMTASPMTAAPVTIAAPAAVPEVVPAAASAAPAAQVTTSTVTLPAAATAEPDRPAIDPNELPLPKPAPLRNRAGEPGKLNGQVAVFISGREKRIYVRHAFVPLFDMPIEIANPGKPLGTHTFTALELKDGGAHMRWNVISMPLTAGHVATPAGRNGAPQPQQRAKYVRGAVVTSESSSAAEALDRVTIPQEAADRIAELLTPGSSLIISDEGLGRETGRYTEFIVETR